MRLTRASARNARRSASATDRSSVGSVAFFALAYSPNCLSNGGNEKTSRGGKEAAKGASSPGSNGNGPPEYCCETPSSFPGSSSAALPTPPAPAASAALAPSAAAALVAAFRAPSARTLRYLACASSCAASPSMSSSGSSSVDPAAWSKTLVPKNAATASMSARALRSSRKVPSFVAASVAAT